MLMIQIYLAVTAEMQRRGEQGSTEEWTAQRVGVPALWVRCRWRKNGSGRTARRKREKHPARACLQGRKSDMSVSNQRARRCAQGLFRSTWRRHRRMRAVSCLYPAKATNASDFKLTNHLNNSLTYCTNTMPEGSCGGQAHCQVRGIKALYI